MTYILNDLLTIRTHREKIALGNLLTAQKKVDEAKLKKARSISDLISYSKWRSSKEQRLMENFMHQSINVYNLENFYHYTEFLREKQILLVDKVKKREQEFEEAEANLRKAKRHYVGINRAKLKLEEHKNILAQEKYIQNELLEENEQDEFIANICFFISSTHKN